MTEIIDIQKSFDVRPADNETGYRSFKAGSFEFRRDEYFAHITWPKGRHVMPVDVFLRALMRDVAWGFFYGTVNFDAVFGTTNLYGQVDMFAGRYNDAYREGGTDWQERFESADLMDIFKQMISDWTIDGYDPFAAPQETETPWGRKAGDNDPAVTRKRVVASRMVGLRGDVQRRSDETGYPVNRMFADVSQEEPVVEMEPGFEDEVAAFSLFAYLSRSDVTWNPSVCSVVKESLYCPTTEEFILPVEHGNDRVEWFMQLSDEIVWDVKNKETGRPRAKVTMRAGDVAAMPADIRHQGYSPKRSMLLVWENASPKIPQMIQKGEAPVVPVTF